MGTVNKDFRVKNGLQVDQTASMGNTTISGFANVSGVLVVGGTTINSTSISGNATTAYNNAVSYAASNTYVNTTFAPIISPTFQTEAFIQSVAYPALRFNDGTSNRLVLFYDTAADYGRLSYYYANGTFRHSYSFSNTGDLYVPGTLYLGRVVSNGNISVSNGQIIESVNNMGTSSTVDLNKAGYFYKTISAANTIVIANTPATGQAAMFILELTNGGAFAITWPAAVKWPGGTPPSFSPSGVDLISFASRDGGSNWRATASLNYG